MKVFISWSGDTSLKVAQQFREWLPGVINSIKPYVSSEDIDKGARWSSDIAKELADSTFGILCVTKDNIDEPWLSFEAGALSKTMEKSFVTPFLFDIKRAEVHGPILQFQSTIFEKDDIKKMLKTLNKACDDNGLADKLFDTSFDLWYPKLEEKLNAIKKNIATNAEETSTKSTSHSSTKILEEILELSRDNQKLLRNPDTRLLESINESLNGLSRRNAMIPFDVQKKMRREEYLSVFFDEVSMRFNRSPYGLLILLSFFREDFPWIYDMGKELIEILKNSKNSTEKRTSIDNFQEMIDFTCRHPMMRELFPKSNLRFMKELQYYLDNL